MLELVVLLVIAFPIVALIGLVMALATRDRLRNLERSLASLERRVLAIGAAAPPLQAGGATTARTVEEIGEPVPEEAPVAETQPSPSPPPPRTRPSTPAPQRPSLEERFGTQWVVWVGGVAIAFGGFFLVRLSIEQGWFGPGTRVVLGALLALALIAAGEWTRRSERRSGIAGLPSAHIPGILTAAGTAVAFADVWAAYGLYHFLNSAAAFVLLGAVALATLAAALLHGPALAGLGMVGAYATPLIVASDEPNYWALYLYIVVVTAASFLLARVRLWRWLAITAIVFGAAWTLPGIADHRVDWITPHDFHVVAGFVLAALLIVANFLFGPDAAPGRIDSVSSAGLVAYLFASMLIVLASGHAALPLATFTLLVAAAVAIAWRAEPATAAVPIAALLTFLVFADWALGFNAATLVLPSGPTAPAIPEPTYIDYGSHLVLGALYAALFGLPGFLAQGRSDRPIAPMLWSASAVFAPIAILVALYYRIAGFDRSVPFAGIALLLAVLFALATEDIGKRAPRPRTAAASAIFATGAVASLALALTMSLEKGWLTIALALIVPGIAWVSLRRPLPALRVLAALVVGIVVSRTAWQPLIAGDDLGTRPIFNWLLYGYGVPAAAFALAGHLLRRRADDGPARTADAGALLFVVLLAFLEIRHAMTGGEMYRRSSSLAELALDASVAVALAIGLEHLRARSRSIIHDIGASVIATLTLLAIVFGLMLGQNPLFTGEPVGGRFINLILLGYALPAALCVGYALVTRGTRPQFYSATAAVAAVALAIAYLSLEVRRFYQGPVLTAGFISDAEQYTYSAVWLVFGVALLALGALLRSQPVRIASTAVIVLTVLKVFFIDLHDLTGIYQALSFIGLGAVLIGIGWFYQRLLFPRSRPPIPQPT